MKHFKQFMRITSLPSAILKMQNYQLNIIKT